MVDKVKIELTPYNALSIWSFLQEYINDDNSDEPEFKAIHEAIKEYKNSVVANMTEEQFNDGSHENKVNQLIGKSPKRG